MVTYTNMVVEASVGQCRSMGQRTSNIFVAAATLAAARVPGSTLTHAYSGWVSTPFFPWWATPLVSRLKFELRAVGNTCSTRFSLAVRVRNGEVTTAMTLDRRGET